MHKLYIVGILLLLSGAVAGTSYVQANGQTIAKINETGTYYYHPDHLGSTSAMTDSKGDVVEEQVNLPFGEVVSGSEKYGFTGKELDETGLQYFGLRFYSPEIGRFITADPLKDGINWYSYARNNPLRFIDPTGGEVRFELDKSLVDKGREKEVRDKAMKIYRYLASPEVEKALGFNPVSDKRIFIIQLIAMGFKIKKTDKGIDMKGTAAYHSPQTGRIPFNIDALGRTILLEDETGKEKKLSLDEFILSGLPHEIDHKVRYDKGELPLTKEFIELGRKHGKKCLPRGEKLMGLLMGWSVTKEKIIEWLDDEKSKDEKKAYGVQERVLGMRKKNKKFDEFTHKYYMIFLKQSKKAELQAIQDMVEYVKKYEKR